MIRITIELVSARTGLTQRIGTALISNDGTGTSSHGNYEAIFHLKRKNVWRTARAENFPRKYKNVWFLLKRLLAEIA